MSAQLFNLFITFISGYQVFLFDVFPAFSHKLNYDAIEIEMKAKNSVYVLIIVVFDQ